MWCGDVFCCCSYTCCFVSVHTHVHRHVHTTFFFSRTLICTPIRTPTATPPPHTHLVEHGRLLLGQRPPLPGPLLCIMQGPPNIPQAQGAVSRGRCQVMLVDKAHIAHRATMVAKDSQRCGGMAQIIHVHPVGGVQVVGCENGGLYGGWSRRTIMGCMVNYKNNHGKKSTPRRVCCSTLMISTPTHTPLFPQQPPQLIPVICSTTCYYITIRGMKLHTTHICLGIQGQLRTLAIQRPQLDCMIVRPRDHTHGVCL